MMGAVAICPLIGQESDFIANTEDVLERKFVVVGSGSSHEVCGVDHSIEWECIAPSRMASAEHTDSAAMLCGEGRRHALISKKYFSLETIAENVVLPIIPLRIPVSVYPSEVIIPQVKTNLPVFCNSDLPFFCRMEVKMEQKFKMPIKFRLGEVQYTERLEGKQSTIIQD